MQLLHKLGASFALVLLTDIPLVWLLSLLDTAALHVSTDTSKSANTADSFLQLSLFLSTTVSLPSFTSSDFVI